MVVSDADIVAVVSAPPTGAPGGLGRQVHLRCTCLQSRQPPPIVSASPTQPEGGCVDLVDTPACLFVVVCRHCRHLYSVGFADVCIYVYTVLYNAVYMFICFSCFSYFYICFLYVCAYVYTFLYFLICSCIFLCFL